jgi:monoamine oxidase
VSKGSNTNALATLFVASALLMMPKMEPQQQPNNTNTNTNNDDDPGIIVKINKVIVIGAGISGLAAARELQTRGYQVVVVEGRGRPGGRLKGSASSSSSNHKNNDNNVYSDVMNNNGSGGGGGSGGGVDLGGALLHGITDNPVYELLEQANIATVPISSDCLVLDDAGWPVESKDDEKALRQFNAHLDETFRTLQHDRPDETSFGRVYDEIITTTGRSSSSNTILDPLLQWHRSNLELSCGCSLSKLGKQWNDDEPYGFEGAHVALPDTWDVVIRQLAAPLDILYHQQVIKIEMVEPAAVASVHPGSPPRSRPPQRARPAQPQPQHQPPPGARTCSTPLRRAAISTTVIARPVTPDDDDDNNDDSVPIRMRSSPRLRGESPPVLSSIPPTTTIGGRYTRRARKAVETFTVDHSKKKKLPLVSPTKSSPKVVVSKNKPSKTYVQITLSSGQTITADACICTLPLGVLKAQVVDIPQLTESHTSALTALGCGVMNKVAITFAKKVWDDSHFIGLAKLHESVVVLNATVVVHQKKTKKMEKKSHERPTLVFLYGGDSAVTMQSQTDQQIMEQCLSHVYRICGTVPDLVDYHITRWGLEPFSRMSFSYVTPEASSSASSSSSSDDSSCYYALSKPICDHNSNSTGRHHHPVPRIMFAGEHTTRYYPSTIHGAFLSGVREAYRLDCRVDAELNAQVQFHDTDVYRPTFSLLLGNNNINNNNSDTTSAYTTTTIPRAAPSLTTAASLPRSRVRRAVFARTAAIPGGREHGGGGGDRTAATTPSSSSSSSSSHQRIPRIVDGAEALQQRTLERCLESYGPNYDLIATLLPTYGGVQLSATQIRRLVPPGRTKKRKLPAAFVAAASSKTVPSSSRRTSSNVFSPKRKKIKGTATPGFTMSASSAAAVAALANIVTTTTRSGRASKPIVTTGTAGTTTAASLLARTSSRQRLPVLKQTTRFGRVVKKPTVTAL